MDIFYFAIAGIFISELFIEKGIVKILCRYVGFFRKEGFWRRGFAGQFFMAFFSLAIMSLLGFGEEFGLTFRNANESLRLFLLYGLPFAVFYSAVTYLFIRKSKDAPNIDWIRNPSNRNGHLIYCFTMNGVGEELFYRGLILGSLSIRLVGSISLGSFDLMYSTVIVSILFILVHLENVINKDETAGEFFLNLPYRATIAFVLGITFQITGSLLAPIIIHNISNGFLSIAAWQATKNKTNRP
jgi:membrane protease YdiL (CAAX protease family)